MNLYIPEIKTELKLTADWAFMLHHERRNEPLFKFLGLRMWNWSFHDKTHPPPVQVSLPAGTVLTVDRIYIRNGASDFSSLTFRASIPGKKTVTGSFGKTGVRFWAKLNDVNRIQCEVPCVL